MKNPNQSNEDQFAKKSQAWSARFSEPVTDLVKRYTASVYFDKRMAQFDIEGSLAHATMLKTVGVIGEDDLNSIERGMAQISTEIAEGRFEWLLDLEDVHLNIEKRLVDLVGDAGKRLHTGRSRNDQVATDIRLWVRAEIDHLINQSIKASLFNPRLDLILLNLDRILPCADNRQIGTHD